MRIENQEKKKMEFKNRQLANRWFVENLHRQGSLGGDLAHEHASKLHESEYDLEYRGI